MFATVGTRPRNLKMGVVNEEALNWMSECNSQKLHWESCDFTVLSCKFINKIQKDELLHLVGHSYLIFANFKIITRFT